MSLPSELAAVRGAVRRSLPEADDRPVLVACSGGADSLALLSAAVFESRDRPHRVIGVTVDHGLQAGSADRTDAVVAQMVRIGVDETVGVRVTVEGSGQGPEAAAREARYAVLEEVAERFDASVVLLGHTRDDQAETVLLGLTRGSGGRSLAGMRPAFDRFRRPLLDVSRAQTEAACLAEGLEWWTDPHNSDPAYTRARIRNVVMPTLERELGPGVAETLARTAGQLRADVELLDAQAAAAYDELLSYGELPVDRLDTLPEALRLRVLRLAALRAGAIPSDLTHGHVLAVDQLVRRWRGQVGVDLPGKLRAVRRAGRVAFVTSDRSA
jgi:tRNA(Ile)-lysidine synthase